MFFPKSAPAARAALFAGTTCRIAGTATAPVENPDAASGLDGLLLDPTRDDRSRLPQAGIR
jgi:hypothetical protein